MHPVVCMITDRRRLGERAEVALIRRVAAAARAGIHMIQIRERDMPDGALLVLVTQAVEAVRGTRTRILVNDRVDVALAAGAHGVHLRGDSAPARRVRKVTPPSFLIGRSVHARDEIVQANAEGDVDYLLFGTVFDTTSKPNRPSAGLTGLTDAVSAAPRLPVLAIGGMTLDSVVQLPHTGCAGFAAIGQFADVPESDIARTVMAALAAWDNQR
ncbi:MAG TPA: thiamine phosphate synthase [Vicinamibacterales bacterium]|nr:thiamine phosphate synthase [Vicinamibacterales bacterium]